MASTFASVSKQIGKVKPETKKIAQEVYEAAKAAGHEIWYIWGMGTSVEHKTGRALDLMVRNEAGGDFVRNYLWKHRARLRLHHVIWEQHITSTTINIGQRRKMEDRGNATANHYDHVHTLHFGGTYRPPVSTTPVSNPSKKTNQEIAAEVWQGKWGDGDERKQRLTKAGYDYRAIQKLVSQGVGQPSNRPVTQRVLEYVKGKPMMHGHDVMSVQTGLWRHFPLYARTLARDGFYGPTTKVRVMEFQRRSGLKADGIVGPKTWKEFGKYNIKP